jgi:hypothetical protein
MRRNVENNSRNHPVNTGREPCHCTSIPVKNGVINRRKGAFFQGGIAICFIIQVTDPALHVAEKYYYNTYWGNYERREFEKTTRFIKKGIRRMAKDKAGSKKRKDSGVSV